MVLVSEFTNHNQKIIPEIKKEKCPYCAWRIFFLRNKRAMESLEGMHAFLEKRKPDFQKFRERNATEVKQYLTGLYNEDNMKK